MSVMALGKMSLALIRLDPGERQVKGQIRVEIIAVYIAEKSAMKCANKRANMQKRNLRTKLQAVTTISHVGTS